MSLTIEERQLIELRIRNDAPNVVVAYVLWGFLGILSAHRFYLGRPRSAVLQILSWLTVVGGLIWWLFDAAMISAYIRDDKAALRAKLIQEMESEPRGGVSPVRPVPTTPPAARAQPPETQSPMAEAAAIPLAAAVAQSAPMPAVTPAGPAKVVLAKPELVLATKVRQPFMLDDAPLTLKPQPFNLDGPAKPEPKPEPTADASNAGWQLAEHPAPIVTSEPVSGANDPIPEPEAEPAPTLVSGPVIPHPESIDASPIEVFPRVSQPIDSLTALDQELAGDVTRAASNP